MWKEILIKRADKTPKLTMQDKTEILHIMNDGEWKTVAEIGELVGSNSRRLSMYFKHATFGHYKPLFESMVDPSKRTSASYRLLWRLRKEYRKE